MGVQRNSGEDSEQSRFEIDRGVVGVNDLAAIVALAGTSAETYLGAAPSEMVELVIDDDYEKAVGMLGVDATPLTPLVLTLLRRPSRTRAIACLVHPKPMRSCSSRTRGPRRSNVRSW